MIPHFVLPADASVYLICHNGFIQGRTTTGQFYIEGLGSFTFWVSDYHFNPHCRASCQMLIKVLHGGSVLCRFRPQDHHQLADEREQFFRDSFLAAFTGLREMDEHVLRRTSRPGLLSDFRRLMRTRKAA